MIITTLAHTHSYTLMHTHSYTLMHTHIRTHNTQTHSLPVWLQASPASSSTAITLSLRLSPHPPNTHTQHTQHTQHANPSLYYVTTYGSIAQRAWCMHVCVITQTYLSTMFWPSWAAARKHTQHTHWRSSTLSHTRACYGSFDRDNWPDRITKVCVSKCWSAWSCCWSCDVCIGIHPLLLKIALTMLKNAQWCANGSGAMYVTHTSPRPLSLRHCQARTRTDTHTMTTTISNAMCGWCLLLWCHSFSVRMMCVGGVWRDGWGRGERGRRGKLRYVCCVSYVSQCVCVLIVVV